MRERRRGFLRLLAGAPGAFAASLASPGRAGAAPPAKGSALALMDLPLLEGGIFRAAEAEGRVLAIYWWASWCPFCREMTPHVEQLWQSQRNRGLMVLGISIDRNAQAPMAYRQRHGYTFPTALYAPSMEPVLPKPKTVPTTWVRDRQGRVAMAATGQLFPEDVADIAKFV